MLRVTPRDITDCLEFSFNELCPGILNSDSDFKEIYSVEMPFHSRLISGTLQFTSEDSFITTVSPIRLKDSSDKLDYCQEFCNILMGRFRYHLLDLGVDVSFGIPRVAGTLTEEGNDLFERYFKYKGASSKLGLIYKFDEKCSENVVSIRKIEPGKSVYYLDYEQEINFNKELKWFTEVGGGLELMRSEPKDFQKIIDSGLKSIDLDENNQLLLLFAGEKLFSIDFLLKIKRGQLTFESHGHHFILKKIGIRINVTIDSIFKIDYIDFYNYSLAN